MSVRDDRRMCARKVRFRDQAAAAVALFDIQRKGKPGKRQARTYSCPHCKGWHLTSQDKRTTKGNA